MERGPRQPDRISNPDDIEEVAYNVSRAFERKLNECFNDISYRGPQLIQSLDYGGSPDGIPHTIYYLREKEYLAPYDKLLTEFLKVMDTKRDQSLLAPISHIYHGRIPEVRGNFTNQIRKVKNRTDLVIRKTSYQLKPVGETQRAVDHLEVSINGKIQVPVGYVWVGNMWDGSSVNSGSDLVIAGRNNR